MLYVAVSVSIISKKKINAFKIGFFLWIFKCYENLLGHMRSTQKLCAIGSAVLTLI